MGQDLHVVGKINALVLIAPKPIVVGIVIRLIPGFDCIESTILGDWCSIGSANGGVYGDVGAETRSCVTTEEADDVDTETG
jgi:hypothetical protein